MPSRSLVRPPTVMIWSCLCLFIRCNATTLASVTFALVVAHITSIFTAFSTCNCCVNPFLNSSQKIKTRTEHSQVHSNTQMTPSCTLSQTSSQQRALVLTCSAWLGVRVPLMKQRTCKHRAAAVLMDRATCLSVGRWGL